MDSFNEHKDDLDYYDSVWKIYPMPIDYTCACGIYVHPSKRKKEAIHIIDCPYYNATT
jgi:hypothetical protein